MCYLLKLVISGSRGSRRDSFAVTCILMQYVSNDSCTKTLFPPFTQRENRTFNTPYPI